MNILFLSHYFPPEVNAPASRTFEHCRVWAAAGHSVTVVTCAPNHPRGALYPGYKNSLWSEEESAGIRVIRLWTYLSANQGFLKRTMNYVSYMFSCIVAIPHLPRADVVVSTSPQFFNGLAGFFVARAKRAAWVLEIRDLWPESILAVGAIKNRAVIGLLKWLEAFAYRHATIIVPVTDAFRDYMTGLGVAAAKIRVIKNGVDPTVFHDDASGDAIRAETDMEGKIVAAYFGTHGMAHHLETILDAAEILTSRRDIQFMMVGDGAEKDRLEKACVARGLENVTMLGQQEKLRMPEFWAMADISLVLLRRTDLFKTVIPSKIFEAMGMRTPIVLGVEGESRAIIEQAGAGFGIEPENAQELATRVVELADDAALRRAMGDRGHAFVREHFDRTRLAQTYLRVLDDACGRLT